MKVEYVSPFAEASINVLAKLIDCRPERGNLSARSQLSTSQQINLVCSITGQVEGLVIYGMSTMTADKLVSKITGEPVAVFDQASASAIAEFGNMISGQSASLLTDQGFNCDITPPTIIRGTNVSVTALDTPALVIQMNIPNIGLLEINVSLQERKKLAA
ncbi:MAG: chemotaxis protein CheX [Chlorobia bacterium]|nr:chemotaxis protein CheX [Fimbriimonadaceae bacterium]